MDESHTDSGLLTPPVPEEKLGVALEALVLTSDRAVPPARLAQALGLEPGAPTNKLLAEAVDGLNASYEAGERAFRIEKTAGGYRAMTMPEAAPVLAAMHGIAASQNLSRAAIETLSIIAYRQPITRAEIEAIRGVATGEVVRSLLDKRLVDITGRAEELGRPMLYGTTKRFLETFGLASIKDLPKVDDFAPSFSDPDAETANDAPSEPEGAPSEPTEEATQQ